MPVKKSLSILGLTFHHVGLAVTDPEPAQQFLKAVGYGASKETADPLQDANLIFCSHGKLPSMELVFSDSKSSPIRTILQNSDQSLYHICYSTKNLKKTLDGFKGNNIRAICVSPPKPAVLFGGKLVSFYFIKGFGLVELLEDSRGK